MWRAPSGSPAAPPEDVQRDIAQMRADAEESRARARRLRALAATMRFGQDEAAGFFDDEAA